MSASNPASCGNRGPSKRARPAPGPANQLPANVWGRAALFTPPAQRLTLPLSPLGSWKQSGDLTASLSGAWPGQRVACLRGGMQAGDARLPGRKCWNLIIAPSLSREINEETKIHPIHPTHIQSTDTHTHTHHSNTYTPPKKYRCRCLNLLLKTSN